MIYNVSIQKLSNQIITLPYHRQGAREGQYHMYIGGKAKAMRTERGKGKGRTEETRRELVPNLGRSMRRGLG